MTVDVAFELLGNDDKGFDIKGSPLENQRFENMIMLDSTLINEKVFTGFVFYKSFPRQEHVNGVPGSKRTFRRPDYFFYRMAPDFYFLYHRLYCNYFLIQGTPESKSTATAEKDFDWGGLISFIIALLSLNIVIGEGSALGWLSPEILIGWAIFIIATIIFFRIETRRKNSFVDLSIFKNKTFSGAPLSNFLLNGAAGTLLVSMALVQSVAGLFSLQSELISVGYLVAIIAILITVLKPTPKQQ